MLVLGHRGAPERHFENTLASFKAAMKLGADGVELDVRGTADGQIVVHHDACLPGQSVPLSELSLAQIKTTRLPQGDVVPTLGEALAAISPHAALVVELKGRSAPPGLQSILGDAANRPGLRISSFNHRMVANLCASRYPVALTVDHNPQEAIEKAERLGASEIHFRHGLIDKRLVERAHSRRLQVMAWTVDSAEDLERMGHLGVDGIITNRVETAISHFKNRALETRGTA